MKKLIGIAQSASTFEKVMLVTTSLATLALVVSMTLYRFGMLERRTVDCFLWLSVTFNMFPVTTNLVSLWKKIKAQEKARFKKEREELAKAEVVLNGPLHNWK